MSVYNYVAESNPNGAKQIINSFGYEVLSTNNLGQSLNELVVQVGEPALEKIMQAHPDKDIILEMFSKSNNSIKSSGCGCKKCQENNGHYLNASGSDSTNPSTSNLTSNTTTLAHQTNVILIVATIFIATALIIKKN